MFAFFVPYMLPADQAEYITATIPTDASNYGPELAAVRPLAEGVGPSACRSERITFALDPVHQASLKAHRFGIRKQTWKSLGVGGP